MVSLKQYNLSDFLSDKILTIPTNIIYQDFDKIFSWYIEKTDPLSQNKGIRLTAPGKWDDSIGLVIDFSEYQITLNNYRIGVYGIKESGEGVCVEELIFTQTHHWIINYEFAILLTKPLLFDLDGNDLHQLNKVHNIVYDAVEKKIDIYFNEAITGNAVISGKCMRNNDGDEPIAIITSLRPEY